MMPTIHKPGSMSSLMPSPPHLSSTQTLSRSFDMQTSRPDTLHGKEESLRGGGGQGRPHAIADQPASPPVRSSMSAHRISSSHNDFAIPATPSSNHHHQSSASHGLRVVIPATYTMSAASPGTTVLGGHLSSTGSGGLSSISHLARAYSDVLDDLEDDDGIEAAVGKLVERAEDLCALEPWFTQEMQEHGHLMPEVRVPVYRCMSVCLYVRRRVCACVCVCVCVCV
jgi:hypothetical protein